MATTDLHMNLTGHDYHADRSDPSGGLTRIAGLIARGRREAKAAGAAVLLVDNGDALQGTPMGDVAADRSGAHPAMRCFAHLAYDALGLGNHDFNLGPEALERVLADAPCPVLSSNLSVIEPGLLARVAPFAVLDRFVPVGGRRERLRIGVLSFLPPQTVRWDAHLLAGRIEVGGIVAAARRWVPVLRRRGCDVIVALAHSGLGPTCAGPDAENAVIPLAEVAGIDAIVAGHTHLLLPGPTHAGLDGVDARAGTVNGTPVVMAGSAGTHLGVIDLTVRAKVGGGWRVAGARPSLWPVVPRRPDGGSEPPVRPAAGLVRLLAADHAATRDEMARPAGYGDRPLHSYFSVFAPDRALALVASAQAAALRPYLRDRGLDRLPVLSATAPGKSGGRAGPRHYTDVPAGPLARRHVADLCAFPDLLRAVVVTGAGLRGWLEMAAILFRQIAPGCQGATLVDAAVPGHNFDVLHGVEYRIDLSVPAAFAPDGSARRGGGRRIRDLAHDGRPVADDDRFVVALNGYRAAGGGNVAALAGARPIAVPALAIRDVVEAYVAGRLAADPLARAPAPWRFVAMPGTVAEVLTGPGAAAHLEDLAGRGVQPRGIDANGFLRLSVPL